MTDYTARFAQIVMYRDADILRTPKLTSIHKVLQADRVPESQSYSISWSLNVGDIIAF